MFLVYSKCIDYYMNKFIVILRLNKEGGIFTSLCNEFSEHRDIET